MLSWPATALLSLTHELDESRLFGTIPKPAATYTPVLVPQYYNKDFGATYRG